MRAKELTGVTVHQMTLAGGKSEAGGALRRGRDGKGT